MVYVRLGNVRVEVLAFDEAEEEFIDNLYVRPRHFQHRLVFFGVESFALGVHGRRDGSEQVLRKHLYNARVHLFGDDLAVVGNIVEQFMQGQTLDLLGLHIATGIVEVEDDVALVNLLHEEFLPLVRGHLVKSGELFQFTLTLIRDVEARRVLPLWGPDSLDCVLGRRLKTIEYSRLLARLWRREVTRHRLGSTGRWYML